MTEFQSSGFQELGNRLDSGAIGKEEGCDYKRVRAT